MLETHLKNRYSYKNFFYFLEIFYWYLGANNNVVADNAAGVEFMSQTWVTASIILDKVTKTNRTWNRQKFDICAGSYVIGAFMEQHRLSKGLDQESTKM